VTEGTGVAFVCVCDRVVTSSILCTQLS
jgi:hypothetical protein